MSTGKRFNDKKKKKNKDQDVAYSESNLHFKIQGCKI